MFEPAQNWPTGTKWVMAYLASAACVDDLCYLLIAGSLSCQPNDDDSLQQMPLSHRLAMICGTSTCHITVSVSLTQVFPTLGSERETRGR